MDINGLRSEDPLDINGLRSEDLDITSHIPSGKLTYIGIEHGHLQWIYPRKKKKVVFHSYVSLPEGIHTYLMFIWQALRLRTW
jgi:hypothetical protein